MKKINILTKGFDSPNGCAFLFPLIKHRQTLADHGIELNFYKCISDSLYDCDTLIVESKYSILCRKSLLVSRVYDSQQNG